MQVAIVTERTAPLYPSAILQVRVLFFQSTRQQSKRGIQTRQVKLLGSINNGK
jgi:hypothetical protein